MKTTLIISAIVVLVLFIFTTWDVLFQIHTYFSAPKKSSAFRRAELRCLANMENDKTVFLLMFGSYVLFRFILDKNHEWKKRF